MHCAFLLAMVVFSSGCGERQVETTEPVLVENFIGSETCQSCHTSQYSDWQSSHHKAAMQVATEEVVLGDFDNVSFDYYSSKTDFLTVDGKPVVRTEDATGNIRDFEVTHTFGVEPLQQYLVDFPGGRKQALPFLWDTRATEDGGQRWFHLYPDEYIEPGDELHWTGPNFNWNFACAECHSTNLEMGYDNATDSFATSWSEISVGCEACHGPGREHLRQVEAQSFDDLHGFPLSLNDQGDANWLMNPDSGMAARSTPKQRPQQQAEACGRCHSRRTEIVADYEYGKALTDTHLPTLLHDGMYFPDGAIQDEVYVYGSFLQSKMYVAGVTCSDCHNPHSGRLKTGPAINDVCAQCHLPTVFSSTDHYGPDSETDQCVDCHMQSRTYMGNDDRRDHFFRIPNESSLRTHAFVAQPSQQRNASLLEIASATDTAGIVAASALIRLTPPYHGNVVDTVIESLQSSDPLVRIGALRALRPMPASSRPLDGAALLADPIRSVRLEAALTYADIADVLEIDDSRAFQSAAVEYRETHEYLGSRAESHSNLATFESLLGNSANAISHLERALQLNPAFVPAYMNLADLVGRAGDNERAIELLNEGLQRSPETAALHHSLGLAKVRVGQSDEALDSLQKAVDLDGQNARFGYVLAVALNSLGKPNDAIDKLTELRQQFPEDLDIAWALTTMLRDSGQTERARQVVTELLRDFPNNPDIGALANSIR